MHRIFVIAAVVSACAVGADNPTGPGPDTVLRELMMGNKRYVTDKADHPNQRAARRTEVAQAQHPSAVILGCADSRVPPEVVFDKGLGDLFVVRVAGNVVNDSVLGSIEYAVEHLGSRLIMVLGHERCGAVGAAVQGGTPEGHVASLVNLIKPSVDHTKGMPGDPVENALRENVHRMVGLLEVDSSLLRNAVHSGKVKIVGARYDLGSGNVELLK